MALSEGSWITLGLGLISLVFVIRNLITRHFVPDCEMQVIQPTAPAVTSIPSVTSTQSPPPPDQISAEEQRQDLEATLETAYREKWIKEWEEEEVKRHFRERAYLQEAQWQEEERAKFEEDQMVLLQLTRYREALEKYVSSELYPSRRLRAAY